MKLSNLLESLDTPVLNTESVGVPMPLVAEGPDATIGLFGSKKTLAEAVKDVEAMTGKYVNNPYEPVGDRVVMNVVDGISIGYRSSNQNIEWKNDIGKIFNHLASINHTVSSILEIVHKYQKEPTSINTEEIVSFKSKAQYLLGLLDSKVTISNEDSFENYVELMSSVLNTTVDNIDMVKSSIATNLNKLVGEIEAMDLNKYIAATKAIQSKIQSSSAKVVTLVDHMLEAVVDEVRPVLTSGEVSEDLKDKIRKLIQHHNYLISTVINKDVSASDSIGLNTQLSDQQVEQLVNAYMFYIKVCTNNPTVSNSLVDVEQEGDNLVNVDKISNLLTRFLNKSLVTFINLQDIISSTILNKKLISIDNNLDTNINSSLFNILSSREIDGSLDLYYRDGEYKFQDGRLVKVPCDKEVKLPKLYNNKYNTIANLQQSVVLNNLFLIEYPKNMINYLKSRELDVTDTEQLQSVTIALGVILALSNIYRDEMLYGIQRVHNSLTQIGYAYYNIIRVVSALIPKSTVAEVTQEGVIDKLFIKG